MCTVAFVPKPGAGYLLGHNRDELRRRSRGGHPRRYDRQGRAFLAPRDPDGGGSWIGVNDAGVTLCMLNAADSDPSRLPPEPTSRGRVLWEMLHLEGVETAARRLASDDRLRRVRAFHMVVVEPGDAGASAVRLRWNGSRLETDRFEGGPRLFVSSSLAGLGVEEARGSSWHRLLARHPLPGREELVGWLASHEPERGPLSVCMHRPEAETVSRTLVTVGAGGVEMSYLDGSPCSPDRPERSIGL